MSEIKAILWDLDGTVIDSEALSTRCISKAMGEYGPVDPLIKRSIVGMRRDEWTRTIIEKSGIVGKLDPDVFGDLWHKYMDEGAHNGEIELMPGVREIILEFQKRGYVQAVATSSPLESAEAKLARYPEIRQAFTTIISGENPAVKQGKPAPDIFLFAAEKLGFSPSECLVMEDAPSGVAAGVSAGMKTVAIRDVNVGIPFEKFEVLNPTLLLTSLEGVTVDSILCKL